MNLLEKLKDWFKGRYIPPPKNDPHSDLIFIDPGRYDQPWLAKQLGTLWEFWLKHWQWVIGTILAIIGIIVSAK